MPTSINKGTEEPHKNSSETIELQGAQPGGHYKMYLFCKSAQISSKSQQEVDLSRKESKVQCTSSSPPLHSAAREGEI